MRYLIINTDYQAFLSWLYTQHPGLDNIPYDQQMNIRNESLFGMADFYSNNLRKLGHEAWDIQVNNEFLQKAWVLKHGIKINISASVLNKTGEKIVKKTPLLNNLPRIQNFLQSRFKDKSWFYPILQAQIEYYRPDVLWNLAPEEVDAEFLKKLKSNFGILVGQLAAPIPKNINFLHYDLMVSSLPNFVQYFKKLGIPSKYLKLGFESDILKKIEQKNNKSRSIPISFVGSLTKAHTTRVELIEYICNNQEISIWGKDAEYLSSTSPIWKYYKGSAWGREMFEILNRSKITLNHHIGISEDYANNMRLYEATGMGTMLLTDWKKNLSDIFEPDKELITYRTPQECVELIRYYLEHDKERETIALAGQKRTLEEHTYNRRMEDLVTIVQQYL